MEESSVHGAIIKLNVKFSGKKYPISISPNATVSDLNSFLSLTEFLPQGQKLIYKGKVLEDSQTLTASNVTNGSNIMLVASKDLNQEGGPILKNSEAVPLTRIDFIRGPHLVNTLPMKERVEFWITTGVIQLNSCNLKAIPDEVWYCGSFGRSLDCSDNSIENVPIKIESLTGLVKLYLNSNKLLEEFISWDGLTTLKHLTILSLSHNRLTTLPPALGSLISLNILYVSHNHLKTLPNEIGNLTKLVLLLADNNRMTTICVGIGKCRSLGQVDFSSNNLSALPETFSSLTNLESLNLRDNAMMKSLPSKLFKNCPRLLILDIDNTEITTATLHNLDGWDKFEERHRR